MVKQSFSVAISIKFLALLAGSLPFTLAVSVAQAATSISPSRPALEPGTPVEAIAPIATTPLTVAQAVSGEGDRLTPLQEADSTDQETLGQVTSVSQLSDVQPTDWAFQALQSLVERYGVIAGYPDGTFRGNRAMTRYEFAAGLNAALDRVNELIAVGTADLVTKEDLATLQRLQEEFAAELATLRGRVDALEARTATLEAQQFSTTTKLSGEAIFSLEVGTGGQTGGVGAFGGTRTAGTDTSVVFNNRVRLNLLTSFTGKDLLITGLQSYNVSSPLAGGGNVQSTLFPGNSILGEGSTTLSYQPQFAGFNPQTLRTAGANNVDLYKLLYIFPVADKLTLFVGSNAEASDAFPAIIPFASEGQGAISRFATLNPVVRVSGGTSQTGLATAAGFIWTISDQIDLRALYGSVNAAIPVNAGFPATPLGSGLFNGSFVAATQLTLKPNSSLDIGLNYAYSYHQLNILGAGLTRFSTNSISLGPNTNLLNPIRMNSVGGTLAWRFAPKVTFTAYGAAIFADAAGGPAASTTFTSWMAGLYFADLFRPGNAGGILFGQPLFRTSVGGAANFVDPGTVSRNTPYHLEVFYNIRLSDNISITPGAFVLFNPEADSANRTTTVGVIRTTFTF